MKVEYTVVIRSHTGREEFFPNLTERQAIKQAKEIRSEHNGETFITWYRASDGQHGFLNPSGNHEIMGISW